MKHILRNHIIHQLGKTPDKLDLVINCFIEINADKNQSLVDINEPCKHCYFIAEGQLKTFYYDLNGEEINTMISSKLEWQTTHNFTDQKPYKEKIIATKESKLLAIGKKQLIKLSKHIPEFENMFKDLILNFGNHQSFSFH